MEIRYDHAPCHANATNHDPDGLPGLGRHFIVIPENCDHETLYYRPREFTQAQLVPGLAKERLDEDNALRE